MSIRPVIEYPMLPAIGSRSIAGLSQQQRFLTATLTRLFGEYGFAVNRLINRIRFGTLADRPSASEQHRFYYATDTHELYYDDGSAWHLIAAETIDATRIDGSTLPTSDPNSAGELWNDGGIVKVSSG